MSEDDLPITTSGDGLPVPEQNIIPFVNLIEIEVEDESSLALDNQNPSTLMNTEGVGAVDDIFSENEQISVSS